ncbi:MAG: penicillin-binding protein activator [Candidatus Diapherotrites archaeon]|nr:penicillin-binding protein activator [Candidatus Diapherotrites archaeon]
MKLAALSLAVLFIAITSVAFLVGCTQNEVLSSNDSNLLRVGLVVPLTGAVSQLGNDFVNGFMLAKDDLNNPHIRVYVEDSQSTAVGGVNAAKKLLDVQNVDVLVSLQSAVVMPVLDIADDYNVPLIATLISANNFTQRSKNAFRLYSPAKQNAELMADFANKQSFQTVSFLTVLDEYGQSMKESFKEKFNGQILFDESFEVGQQDYRTFLMKLPDNSVLFFVGYNQHYINLLKERQELGKKITILSNENFVSKYLQSQSGLLLTDGYAVAPVSILFITQNNKFNNDFAKKYSHAPDFLSPFGYDVFMVLDKTEKNGKPLASALYEVKINGLTGVASFDVNRESNPGLLVFKVEDGNVIPAK